MEYNTECKMDGENDHNELVENYYYELTSTKRVKQKMTD